MPERKVNGSLTEDTYIFPALPKSNATSISSGYNSTETAIGILCACITLAVVLLFLWKRFFGSRSRTSSPRSMTTSIVKKKQESMMAELTYNNRRQETRLSAKTQFTSQRCVASSAVNSSSDGFSMQRYHTACTLPERTSHINKSYSIKRLHAMKEIIAITNDDRELSRGGRLTDYRTYLEMDLCDPKDLIVSLKNDRMVLRKRISERESKLREAQQTVEQCIQLLSRDRPPKDRHCSRLCGIKNEVLSPPRHCITKQKHKPSNVFPKCFSTSTMSETKESFFSMLYWFEGMRLHPLLRQIAEDLFTLRRDHRLDSERDLRTRSIVGMAIENIKECQKTLARSRKYVKSQRSINRTSEVKARVLTPTSLTDPPKLNRRFYRQGKVYPITRTAPADTNQKLARLVKSKEKDSQKLCLPNTISTGDKNNKIRQQDTQYTLDKK